MTSRESAPVATPNKHAMPGDVAMDYNFEPTGAHRAPEQQASPEDGNDTRTTQEQRFDAIRAKRDRKVTGVRERKTMRQRMSELTQSLSGRLDARHARKQSRDIRSARRQATAAGIRENAFNDHATELAARSARSEEQDEIYGEHYQDEEAILATIDTDLADLNANRDYLLGQRAGVIGEMNDIDGRIASDDEIEEVAEKYAKRVLKSRKSSARTVAANSKNRTSDQSEVLEDDDSDSENEEPEAPDNRSEAAKKRDEKVEQARARRPLHRRFGSAVLGAMDRRSTRKQSRDIRSARREATADTIVVRETENAINSLRAERAELQDQLADKETNELSPIEAAIANLNELIADKEALRELQVEGMNDLSGMINANRQHILTSAEIAKRSKRHSRTTLRARKSSAVVVGKQQGNRPVAEAQTEDDDMEQAA